MMLKQFFKLVCCFIGWFVYFCYIHRLELVRNGSDAVNWKYIWVGRKDVDFVMDKDCSFMGPAVRGLTAVE